ncbi:metallophosphoesterase [Geomonas ferrireducens]|uniref:metallophosphoesterase n=1 Tax=Geomonas ferrireducens TaxID=2570227 RepID=UPI0013A5C273|nr:metallophosphoesterase [Geomonas ferrireducens]
MAIIVGDIHGNLEKVQAFLEYQPDHEHIALGDYLDSPWESLERQLRALQLLMESPAVLLWGNHDLHYLVPPPFRCSGIQYRETVLQEIIEANHRRFVAAYVADGWLCTHSGCSTKITRGDPPEQIATRINEAMNAWLYHGERHSIFDIGIARDGSAALGGCFWFDLRQEKLWLDTGIQQIFGHTSLQKPEVAENYVALNTEGNRDNVYLFDTQTNQIIVLPQPDRRRRCSRCLMLVDYLNNDGTCTDCGRSE